MTDELGFAEDMVYLPLVKKHGFDIKDMVKMLKHIYSSKGMKA